MSRKPRADSKLKTLPEERQAAIAEYARAKTLAETLLWLREDGLQTSAAALSEFLSWFALQQQLQRNASTVETLLANLSHDLPEASPEKIQAIGQSFFSALALEQQDAKGWFLTQQINLKNQQLSLDREKFQRETCEMFLKWYSEKAAKEIIEAPGLSQKDKIEKLGQQMFGDLW